MLLQRRYRIQQAAMTTKVQRIMTQPIMHILSISKTNLNLIFRFLQSVRSTHILNFIQWFVLRNWLIFRVLCCGFDEYINLVLKDAEEVNIKKKTRKAQVQLAWLSFFLSSL
uniref:Uncharacterized protein n=1 Tax=Lactuca sativa TaxID=4236 RepID=A0A9R1XRU4_LACSA|nr:hypothetical protein LSAT_V11C100038350 [Lactuca sativa]